MAAASAQIRRFPVRVAALIGLVAGFGLVAAQALPLLGAAAIAMLTGVAIRTLAPARLTAGIPPKLGSKVLQLSIVALGLSVNLAVIARVTQGSLVVMLTSLVIGLVTILVFGRLLGLDLPMAALIAAGTSICGASAIAAVAPVVGASSRQVARAVTVIFAFNLTAVVLFPLIARAISMGDFHYAVWAGTAVNDTSSVLAAAFAFGPATVAEAATVKLARTIMIVPVVLAFAALAPASSDAPRPPRTRRLRLIPLFVVAFLAGAALNSVGLVPEVIALAAPKAALVGTVVALSAIGLTVDLRSFRGSGATILLLGLLGWLIVAASSLSLIEIGGFLPV